MSPNSYSGQRKTKDTNPQELPNHIKSYLMWPFPPQNDFN